MVNYCSHSFPVRFFETWGVVQSGMCILWLDIVIFTLYRIRYYQQFIPQTNSLIRFKSNDFFMKFGMNIMPLVTTSH